MRIYVAGPYTLGDAAVNVRNAIKAGDELLMAGHLPFIPHLSHFWHLLYPHPHESWIVYDLGWLKLCEALIRLPGESSGADGEVDMARQLGMPVYFGVEEFLNVPGARP